MPIPINRRWLAAAPLVLAAALARAQAWPAHPIKMVVPNAPGGLSDISARLLAPGLGARLGQPIVIENRPGAGGTIATASVAKAPADGYTLIAVFDAHASNPHLFRNLDYDGIADFAPVSLLVRGPLVLVVHPRVAAKSARELAALARARPGAINFAAVGPGSPARLLAEYFKLAAGIDFTVVPYKGAAPALTDLVSGEVDAMFATVPSVGSHLKAGRLRALAVTSEQPTPALPGVPTMNEAWPGYVAEAWVGLLAPAKTPAAIVERIHDDAVQALADPDLRARFAAQGLETVASTPAELGRWIRVETGRWGRVIREQKIRIE
ncbi:MAG TPA: tripartite tricarboxylate transporter substrate binding protein [Burkholderiales bacterium]|nr:tripartite tricarboxylate transporter substrate binding protein [Burkholderiales bacterium]